MAWLLLYPRLHQISIMKHFISYFLFLCIILTGMIARGQQYPAVAGIYLSAEDYRNGTLTYRQADPLQKYKIRADQPGKQSKVKVIRGDETINLDKSSLYGFRDGKNRLYRVFNKSNFRILSSDSLMLYSREETVANGKERLRKTNYYFSDGPDGRLVKLTMDNLKQVYRQNRAFHDLLDMHFSSDRDLMRYDKLYSQYKVEYLLDKTIGNL